MKRSLLPFILCTVIAAQAALADDLLPAPPSPSQPPAQLPGQSPPPKRRLRSRPRSKPWRPRAPRAKQTYKSYAPTCGRAADESSPVSSSIRISVGRLQTGRHQSDQGIELVTS